ncbi:MAG: hypothetical protein BWK77_08050 [Verrucomicrobia bacterium A1]|nr:MAG: hypothetical protein BWK77_08050 [Verrucomicrobia bacterium A1]
MKKLGILAALALAGTAQAATIEDTARQLLARYKDAIVPVSGVLKIEIPGGGEARTQEQPLETYGTVLTADGLTVVSASALNPLGNIGPIEINVGGQPQSVRPRASTSQIKIRLADGAEVPARQVLTDEDLDVTFLVPDPAKGETAPAFAAFLDFGTGAAEAQTMDEIIGLGRVGKLFNWAPAGGLSRIVARVEKPRTIYLFSTGFTGGLGTPIFTRDGKPLGVVVLRRQPGGPAGSRQIAVNQAPIILPAADLADLVKQAAAAAAKKPKP